MMREFSDHEGRRWQASVRRREGTDFKGRFYFYVRPVDGPEDAGLALPEIRWNSEKTAQRTLSTMSDVELRRRLRSVLGRRPEEPSEAARRSA